MAKKTSTIRVCDEFIACLVELQENIKKSSGKELSQVEATKIIAAWIAMNPPIKEVQHNDFTKF